MTRNVGSSFRDRVTALEKTRGLSAHLLLKRWAAERYLHRVSVSPYRGTLALKGAYLFLVWDGYMPRKTGGLDLQSDISMAPAEVATMLAEIARTPVTVDDGTRFGDPKIFPYPIDRKLTKGVRALLPCTIATAELYMSVAIVFGDPIVPGVEERWHPTMLRGAGPSRLRCCPRETMVAEKLAVCATFGAGNSRMRDYFDLWYLMRRVSFTGDTLLQAVRRTFEVHYAGDYLRRSDGHSESAFSPDIATADAERRWEAWLVKNAPQGNAPSFADIVEEVGRFALPLLRAARGRRHLDASWYPDRGWCLDNPTMRLP